MTFPVTSDVTTHVTTDDEILACEAEILQAQLTSDVAILDRLLDDNLVFTSFDGTLAHKSDDLALHRSGKLKVTRMDPVDRHIMHLGVTSVVSVLMSAEAIIDGVTVASTMRYTRVWHKRPQGWRLVAGHMSAVLA